MGTPKTMRAWRVHEYGRPRDVLRIDEVPVPDPGPGEVCVRVQAIPLNLNDMERVTGQNMMVRPELPTIPGMEVMGVVEACGDGASEWMGRRVVAMTRSAFGGFAEYAACPTVSAFDMPEAIPLPDAAALYFPFQLAWIGLVDRAALQAGESVLVHAGAGGAGSAAIQLAKHRGARVFATASRDHKLELCRELGADIVIDYSKDDFLEVVLDETGGRGVDVVFDSVGESVMEKSMKCIAYNGRYVMNGFASDKSVVDEKFIVPRSIAAGNFSLCGVLLAFASDAMAAAFKRGPGWNFLPEALGERAMHEIASLVMAGDVKAVVGRVAAFEDVPEAMEALASRETVGRTIVQLW